MTKICTYVCNSISTSVNNNNKNPSECSHQTISGVFYFSYWLTSKIIYVLVDNSPEFPDIFVTFKKVSYCLVSSLSVKFAVLLLHLLENLTGKSEIYTYIYSVTYSHMPVILNSLSTSFWFRNHSVLSITQINDTKKIASQRIQMKIGNGRINYIVNSITLQHL